MAGRKRRKRSPLRDYDRDEEFYTGIRAVRRWNWTREIYKAINMDCRQRMKGGVMFFVRGPANPNVAIGYLLGN